MRIILASNISITLRPEGKDKALEYLEKAMDRGNWSIVFLAHLEPVFKPYYNESRFKKIKGHAIR